MLQLYNFTQNQLHILIIPIFHIVKNYPKLVEIPLLYRLGILSKICHFCNVLKTLNNSYQQTHHLELNRMVQTVLLQHVWLLRYLMCSAGIIGRVNNSAIEHATKSVSSVHSQSTAHSNYTRIHSIIHIVALCVGVSKAPPVL